MTCTIPDLRHADHGLPIGQHGYADQPNLVKTDDGAWLCVMTVGAGHEGEPGQHIIATRSTDKGHTWSTSVPIEPPTGPEASWAVACKAPNGRIFVFYIYNIDNLRTIAADKDVYPDGYTTRVDSIGAYVYRWSDDHGRTWSAQRGIIPVRETAIDRNNATAGKVRMFWNVSSPQIIRNGQSLIVTLHKVAGFGKGFFTGTQGWMVRSDDLMQCDDPTQATWLTLPDGDVGLSSPDGPIAEEQCLAVLSDGSLYCTYRTIDGYSCHAYSRDHGHTWTAPSYMTDTPYGRRIKNPRAANFVWRVEPNLYLYWHHNHGTHDHENGGNPYQHRNPAWVRFGREMQGKNGIMLQWSLPEILLYDDQHMAHRFSYPDLIIEADNWYISETQKALGRIHTIPERLVKLARAWAQRTPAADAAQLIKYAVLSYKGHGQQIMLNMPVLPEFYADGIATRQGITIHLTMPRHTPGILVNNLDAKGKGIRIVATDHQTVGLCISDGNHSSYWESDPVPTNRPLAIGITIDGGPHVISFMVNNQFHDGGSARQFGWGRFHEQLTDINSDAVMQVSEYLTNLYLFDHALLNGELACLQTDD